VLLGLDIGTAGASAVAIDETGTVVARAFSEYATSTPSPGWIEQNPSDWWRAATQVLAVVAAAFHGEVDALGLTGQPGTVFADATGAAVRPAILGGDRRAASQAQRIGERVGTRRVAEICGSPALPDQQAPAIIWLRDVEPVQFRHTRRVLLPKDHVRLMLTGEAATDAADASGTLLLDLRRRAWSTEMLDAIEVPAGWLPPVQKSVEIVGGLRPSLATELGLPPGMPVAAGAGAAAAAAVSTGIVASGLIGSSIEASGVLDAQTAGDQVDPGGLVQTACDASPHRFRLTGLVPSAGRSLRWWRDVVGGRSSDDELGTQAESAAVGAGGLFFKPHIDGGGGAFAGLRAHHTRADLTRALMEGVVFSLRERLDVMRALGIDPHQIRATGGGARNGLWRQLQADIFDTPVAALTSAPSAVVGAALLAGVATGVFSNVAAASASVARLGRVVEPEPERVARYDQLYRTFTALETAIRPAGVPQAP
jgi:xylulokinase